MVELALEDVHGDSFAYELDGVTVAKLVRRDAAADATPRGKFAQGRPNR